MQPAFGLDEFARIQPRAPGSGVVLGLRIPNSHAARRCRHDASPSEYGLKPRQHLGTRGALSARWEANEAEYASMGQSVKHREFAEVLVRRDQDAPITDRPTEDLRVSGVLVPVSDMRDIVTGL